jgi:2-isopropylmalate synthase
MSDRIYIFDTTLRDGEQSPGCSMDVSEKLRMAGKLVELGVDILEAGFPIASEGDFEAVSAISSEFPGAQVAAFTRCCTVDIERAAKALARARRPRIHTVIGTSDIHLKYKLKKTRRQVLEEAVAAVELARRYVDDVEFCTEDGSRTELAFLVEISKAAVEAGARTVNIPDTVGYSVPSEYGALIAGVVRAVGDSAVVSAHCHDDLGLAVANSLAAISAGARQVECTINGIGERAGNAALEEIVMAILKTFAPTSIRTITLVNTEQISIPSSQTSQLAEITCAGAPPTRPSPAETPSRTRQAFIRTAMLKEKSDLRDYGPRNRWVCQKRDWFSASTSGRHALLARCKSLGYNLTRAELDDLYFRFTAVADHRKKGLMDEEILALINGGQKATGGGGLVATEQDALVLPGDGSDTEGTKQGRASFSYIPNAGHIALDKRIE